jgi:hypothetical protein
MSTRDEFWAALDRADDAEAVMIKRERRSLWTAVTLFSISGVLIVTLVIMEAVKLCG